MKHSHTLTLVYFKIKIFFILKLHDQLTVNNTNLAPKKVLWFTQTTVDYTLMFRNRYTIQILSPDHMLDQISINETGIKKKFMQYGQIVQ